MYNVHIEHNYHGKYTIHEVPKINYLKEKCLVFIS